MPRKLLLLAIPALAALAACTPQLASSTAPSCSATASFSPGQVSIHATSTIPAGTPVEGKILVGTAVLYDQTVPAPPSGTLDYTVHITNPWPATMDFTGIALVNGSELCRASVTVPGSG